MLYLLRLGIQSAERERISGTKNRVCPEHPFLIPFTYLNKIKRQINFLYIPNYPRKKVTKIGDSNFKI